MDFNLENFKSKPKLERESNDFEDSKLINDSITNNELEFSSNIKSAEENLLNREKLQKLMMDSVLIKEEPTIKEKESKSKLQEKMDKIRESIRNLID
jgi:hypothetical protein